MNEIKERNEIAEEYKWDLSSLFKNDEEWQKALGETEDFIKEAASYQGKLHDPATIAEFFKKDTELSRKMEDIFCYVHLRKSEDNTNEKAQAMFGQAMSRYVELMTVSAYVEPEILSMSIEELNGLLEYEGLKDYRFNLEKLIKKKAHTLSVEEERIMASFAEVNQAAGEIADYLMDADMVFDSVKDSEGQEHEVSGANYILLQSNPDRTLRENSFRSFYKTYRQHNNTLTSTYSTNVKAATVEAKLRHYPSSREMSMSQSDIPQEVYDQLIATVHAHMPAMHRYASLRKKILKLDELHYYDVYTPLVASAEKEYTYEQAQELILEALAPLGKEYTDVVRSAFKDRWIDVYPNKGKSTGAFSSGTYDSNPYILTNFTGTLDSVSTIAHEMGHSMHSYLSHRHQPAQYAHYTLFVAEVASTVNENLLIEKLLSEEKDPKVRLALLNQYLENFKGTVYRQTMFAEFEKKAHELVEARETLTPALLNKIYADLIRDYFGEDLVIDDEVQYEWSRIPHFYRPFYVYVYATGYSTAVALSEKILHEGEEAVKKYLEFLSMGGSEYPLNELKHAGVDLTTPEPIDIALQKFERVLKEAEEIATKLEE
ncbi:MAG: oligoendopeptidase F [Erysipelotrichaceae bacterium]|nr:oligoendopeptidase F [Erysipelotrichaceae bacterium]